MKPHRRRNSTPRRNSGETPEPVPPAAEPTEEPAPESHPEPVPPAADATPQPVPPAQEQPPTQETQTETVYDYTQGGDQPQVYHQESAAASPQEPVPPAADPYEAQPQTPAEPEPQYQPPPVSTPAPSPAQVSRPAGAPRRSPRAASLQRKMATGSTRPGHRGRPGQSPYQPPASTGFSFMSVMMMIVAAGLLVICIMVLIPTNLKGVKGYAGGKESIEKTESANLLDKTQKAMLAGEEISFSEEEVNRYLATRVKGKAGSIGTFKGVCIDFEPGQAEIFIERTFMGMAMTTSTRYRLHNFGNEAQWRSAGGRIGKLNLSGESQFGPIVTAFNHLKAAMKAEVELVDGMSSKIKFEKDKVVLDYH